MIITESFVIEEICYLRQYCELKSSNIAGIKGVKLMKISEKKIYLSVSFTLGLGTKAYKKAKRCCFFLSRCSLPSNSTKWKYCGEYILSNGSEANLFMSLTEY